MGVLLQRSVLVCFLILPPVAFLFLNSESILLILYQSPCVARWVNCLLLFLLLFVCLFIFMGIASAFRLTGKYCKIVAISLPVRFQCAHSLHFVLQLYYCNLEKNHCWKYLCEIVHCYFVVASNQWKYFMMNFITEVLTLKAKWKSVKETRYRYVCIWRVTKWNKIIAFWIWNAFFMLKSFQQQYFRC